MKIKKLVISALVMALYVVVMVVTQSFSFGPVQVRLATSLYSLAYLMPFLIVPLGLANFLSNLVGGLGLIDMIGGCLVGIVTTTLIYLLKKFNLSKKLIVLPIILVPSWGVAIWLSYLYQVPYLLTVGTLMLGQVMPAILGKLLVEILEKKGSVTIV